MNHPDDDEEARLRERLKGRQMTRAEEERLRERLKERRRNTGKDEDRGPPNDNISRSYDRSASHSNGDHRPRRDRAHNSRDRDQRRLRQDHHGDSRRSIYPPMSRGRPYADRYGPPTDRYGPPPPRYNDSRGWRGPPPRGPPSGHWERGYSPPRDDRYYLEPDQRRGRSISRSRSRSSRRSYSSSRSRSRSQGRARRRASSSTESSRGSSVDSRSVSSRSASPDGEDTDSLDDTPENALTKDRRTVFISQLVMRADEKDLKKYFRKVGCKVREIIMLRDKRTGRHKGIAYIELGRLEDVPKAVEVSGQPPDFQRFPILIKASEAEKNHVVSTSQTTLTASMMDSNIPKSVTPLVGTDGKPIEAQKVYLGNLDPRVSREQLYQVFCKFGLLEKVTLQMDPSTGTSRGFGFLSFRDPKDANLAIQTMSGQLLAGRPLKTGWANQGATVPGVEVKTSTEFPEDATSRIQSAHLVLAKFAGTNIAAGTKNSMARVLGNSAGVPPLAMQKPVETQQQDATIVVGADNPTKSVLVHNMFNKDEEGEPGWEEDIRLDFVEECTKWGKITDIKVMSKEEGGKIYATFESISQAQTCASNLAGRWFDKRQLRVEFVAGIP